MAKIPAVIIILVGLAVAGFSYFLNSLQGKNSFTLFVIFGALMVLYGLWKLIFHKKENVEQHERHLSTGKHTSPNQTVQNQNTQNNNYVFCPYCGSIIKHNFRFCYNCGSRLKE